MALGITYEERDGALHLTGWLDGAEDLEPIVTSTMTPLVLNLRGIKAVNSLGLRRFIDLMRVLGDRPIEFHECPSSFIDAVNAVPLVVGGQSRIGRIKSALVPMTCDGAHGTLALVPITDLRIVSGTVKMPSRACRHCGKPLVLEQGMEPDDFFFFLIA